MYYMIKCKAFEKLQTYFFMKGSESMNDELYTVQDVARILKTNTAYVYKLQQSGLLKFMKIGRLKCRKATLEKFLEEYDGYDITDPTTIETL